MTLPGPIKAALLGFAGAIVGGLLLLSAAHLYQDHQFVDAVRNAQMQQVQQQIQQLQKMQQQSVSPQGPPTQ